ARRAATSSQSRQQLAAPSAYGARNLGATAGACDQKPPAKGASVTERIERTQKDGNLAWLDLEMTGLDAMNDVIVQAALIVTDAELKVLEEFACDVWQPEQELQKMTPFVRDMHEKTGLLARVKKSRVDVLAAERRLLERIAGWCPYPATLCGNTIGQD